METTAQGLRRWRFWREEPALVLIGLLQCVAAAVVKILIWGRGTPLVPPEGDLSRAFSFDAAVGMFTLTTALIVPISPLGPTARRIFRSLLFTFCAYGLVIENVQHLRGLDPRYSSFGGPADSITGIIFGVLAFIVVAIYAHLTIAFFRARALPGTQAQLYLGIRYGLITTALGLVAGIWMGAIQGRFIPESGNIIWLHGFGFHGVQAVPLIAWLVTQAYADEKLGARLIHLGGIAWASCIVLIGLQTLLGRDIYAWELIPTLALICAIVWVVALAKAVTDYARSLNARGPGTPNPRGAASRSQSA